jgi:flagellar assembly factor FliW
VKKVSDIPLKGTIIGFDNEQNYVLQAEFGEASPFRLLTCKDSGLSFVVVYPYYIMDDYTFDVEDDILEKLSFSKQNIENIALLCIVRHENHCFYVNLRSPVVVNTEKGLFLQIILQNEAYPVSAPFVVKEAGK